MRVKVLYLGLVRNKVGKREEEMEIKEDSSLSDLLDNLMETYGENLRGIFQGDEHRLDPTFITTVNGTFRDPFRGGEVKLKDGDIIALMTLISGG